MMAADALILAKRVRKPSAPFGDMHPFPDAGRAFEAQRMSVEDHLTDGPQVIGRKLGMTSRGMQVMPDVDQPVSGLLTAGMVLSCGQQVELGQLVHPQAEPRIAVVPVSGMTLGMPGVASKNSQILHRPVTEHEP